MQNWQKLSTLIGKKAYLLSVKFLKFLIPTSKDNLTFN